MESIISILVNPHSRNAISKLRQNTHLCDTCDDVATVGLTQLHYTCLKCYKRAQAAAKEHIMRNEAQEMAKLIGHVPLSIKRTTYDTETCRVCTNRTSPISILDDDTFLCNGCRYTIDSIILQRRRTMIGKFACLQRIVFLRDIRTLIYESLF
jgi:uncharacterized CHY-type Zn-finger protein